jgi:hypothetical protein
MLDASRSKSTVQQSERLVVLLLPELLDALPNVAVLRATFAGPVRRVLVCFAERADPALLARLAETGIDTQILLGPNVDLPGAKGVVLKAPPGTSPTKVNEFALALSDVVLIGPATQKAPPSDQIGKLIEQLALLKKPMVVTGAPLPMLPPTISVTRGLDPVTPGFRYRIGRWLGGRIEQLLMNALGAFGFSREREHSIGENIAINLKCFGNNLLGIAKCFGRPCSLHPYFAPDHWTDLAPDRRAQSPASPVVVGFEAFDRTALFGAHVHRDMTWGTHLFAAFAVLCAVGAQYSWRALVTDNGTPCQGEVSIQLACPVTPNRSRPPEAPPNTSTPEPSAQSASVPNTNHNTNSVTLALPKDVQDIHRGLNISELFLLGIVVATWWFLHKSNLQERWMACRLGAEQLRIARMSLPMLVLPPALATSEEVAVNDTTRSKETQFSFRALAEVKRIVREQGLPQLGADFSFERALQWLRLIVEDQRIYHQGNYRKLEQMKNGLELLTFVIFIIAAGGVIMHLRDHQDVWLFATAGFPALGAALHAAGTRLGIVHRAALSNDTAKALARLECQIDELGKSRQSAEILWTRLRLLTESAAEIMGRENTSWHGLVSRYTDELPA